MEVIQKIQEVLRSECEDPAAEIIRHGKAMVAIGKTLQGKSLAECRAILRAVADLSEVAKP